MTGSGGEAAPQHREAYDGFMAEAEIELDELPAGRQSLNFRFPLAALRPRL